MNRAPHLVPVPSVGEGGPVFSGQVYFDAGSLRAADVSGQTFTTEAPRPKHLRLVPPVGVSMDPPKLAISLPDFGAGAQPRAAEIEDAESRMRVGNPADYEPEFRAPSIAARSLAKAIAISLLRNSTLRTPEFLAAGDGAVHLRWRSPRGELLISAPFEGGRIGQFYGRTTEGTSIKGTLSTDGKNAYLTQWLAGNV